MEGNNYISQKKFTESKLWKNFSKKLMRIDLELTERCNFNCIHCYINQPENNLELRQKELSTEQIKCILKEALDLGAFVVKFTGGEPLLREDFKEIYIYARKIGLRVILLTNASLITSKLVKLFKRVPPLEKIEISVYGMNSDSYLKVTRKKDAYRSVIQGLNLLEREGIPFIVRFTLFPFNLSEVPQFQQWAANFLWTDNYYMYNLFFCLRGRRDSESKNKRIKKLRISPEEGICFLRENNETNFDKSIITFCEKFTRPQGTKLFSCGAGAETCYIDAYGNFQLCIYLKHPKTMFNLENGSLKDALENFSPEIRQFEAKNSEYLFKCARCFLKGLCESCPARSWLEHAQLDSPVDYLCKITHLQAEYVGLLRKDEKAWDVTNWEERLNS